jgi:hypothetical protein
MAGSQTIGSGGIAVSELIKRVLRMTPLLKPAEVATILNVSPGTLRGLVRDGLIGYVVTGRGKKRPGISFEPAEIERFKADRSRRECPSSNVKIAPITSTNSGLGFGSFAALRKSLPKPKRVR